MTAYALVGWVGTAWVLAAYIFFVYGFRFAQGKRYLVLNIIGTVLMMINMLHAEQWPMVFFQLAWIGVSAGGLARRK